MEKIGFVGTGAMGSALLSRLKLANVTALAFDIAPAALEAARKEGAEAASSAKAVAQASTMIDVVVRTDMDGGDKVDGRQHEGFHRSLCRGLLHRDVGDHSTALTGEELVVVEATWRPGRAHAPSSEDAVNFAHGAVVPAQNLFPVNHTADRRNRHGLAAALVHPERGGVGLEEAA